MFCYIANWKTYFSYLQELAFFKEHQKALCALAKKQKIIICPSFLTLSTIQNLIPKNSILLGAQNISAHEKGAFTGEVSAQSLHEVGCSAVLIGHSECRRRENENNETLLLKIKHALDHNLLPILCIGETLEEYQNGHSLLIIEKQLELLKKIHIQQNIQFYIAYEPIFAIGSGVSASPEHVKKIVEKINILLIKIEQPQITFSILYGGSVNADSARELKQISLLNGFLIGKSSTDFAEFKKIIDT